MTSSLLATAAFARHAWQFRQKAKINVKRVMLHESTDEASDDWSTEDYGGMLKRHVGLAAFTEQSQFILKKKPSKLRDGQVERLFFVFLTLHCKIIAQEMSYSKFNYVSKIYNNS